MSPVNPVRAIALVGLDAVYSVAGITTLLVGSLRGGFAKAWDHVRRRVLHPIPVRSSDRPCLWVHGVSVGEVLAARSLVQRWEAAHPDWDVVVSASTRLGLEAAQRAYPGALVVSYPFDFSWRVRAAFRQLRPDLIVVVEHDLWPGFLSAARTRNVPVVLVNARLSDHSSRRLRRLAPIVRWPPRSIVRIATQEEDSAIRFRDLGFPPGDVVATGNLKFHTPAPPESGRVRADLGLTDDAFVLLASSTHHPEEEAVLDAFARLREADDSAVLIMAPRRIERTEEVESRIAKRGWSLVRWSACPAPDADVILVDTIGDLARITGAADVVFVGGSLAPVGGHSVIEPASYGKPAIIGPHVFNARSVVREFLDRDALVQVDSAEALAAEVVRLHASGDAARAMGTAARDVVEENRGATERVLGILDSLAPSR